MSLSSVSRESSKAAGISTSSRYAAHVNPQWVRLLDLLDMNVRYERCVGAELWTEDGDPLSGLPFRVLRSQCGPQSSPYCRGFERRTGPLRSCDAAKPCPGLGRRIGGTSVQIGGRRACVRFSSQAQEAKGLRPPSSFRGPPPAAMRLLYAEGAFHGLTCGALSLMDNEFWRAGFGPLLPDTDAVPFDDVAAVERKLQTQEVRGLYS